MGLLDGKVALVTGGSRGIGRAIALRLATEGADLAICARNVEAAGAVATEIEGFGRRCLVRQTDVANTKQAGELIEATIGELGRLDVLVNNAGITRDGLLMRMKEEDWDEVLAINLKGAFNCAKAAVRPMLKARGGRIINITSVVGLQGNAGQANYAASKAGLIGLTKSLARELASRGITANAVAPGLVPDTGMTGELAEEIQQQMLAGVPLGRAGTPEDVAHAVAFLASEQAAYITGQVLAVDGGMVM
ncbi:MAG: 3-oxoacyl-[acyl-carrier-protein] reductase [Gemmatimonadetes bacterium]|jgi:3-oxoacyl-[acyl-carrier protein] reductase|nr:3-oxoacyl-[acyl-carrier-protein] reductase [Gemmatimonadota bacterium]MBT5325203.1 3-oxoacyl-[acyl-carrier-protein] reductase [Gemmatimonadota bacterium]MBT5450667.1 3-oxoacyl-[acyl-carrier-protein] reductase [Gemmatimonadota bacterium]MBT5802960.1 3-oxoacyl-[acyl-carrier-protein] reductase [Gemmatimonadota bacterium]MBT6618865.1 3-oxoacyl-[acyl-carrier-protein] reductase [Gemmatimonadota bacterium]|tara:strand:+ start:1056 stop:1802 length:747 start_codon:yes stop_codon:yes gene_type:complete